jgi:CHAT domain-containing protein
MVRAKLFIFLICFTLSQNLLAQQEHTENLKRLDNLLQDKKYTEAQAFAKNNIATLHSKKSYYLLTDYIYYSGKIESELQSQADATQVTNQFVKTITKATDSLKVLRQVYLNLAMYYEYIGDSQNAYDSHFKALELTKKWTEATPEDFGLIESNLAVLANRKGAISTSIKHAKKGLKLFESYPKTNKKNLYLIYNVLGGSMYFESKIDSAIYYYLKAEKTLKLMEPTPLNSYYRQAILHNNLAAIYEAQGELEKALDGMNKTINYLNAFLKSDAADNKKEGAQEFLYTAIDNYAGFYKEIGDFEKAKELLEYAYKEKQKHFKADNPELYKSKILLGQIYLTLKDYSRAETFLNNGIAHLKSVESGPNYWNADAHYSKALLYDEQDKKELAKQFYDQAEQCYIEAYEGSYDELYLDFSIKASRFYAQNQEKDKALKMAHKAYDYLKKNQETTTSFEIQQALNLGEIYYALGDYESALTKALATSALLESTAVNQIKNTTSSQIILYKPQTVLLKTQAAYQLTKNQNDISSLKKAFADLKEAIVILEKQKTLVSEENNVSILIQNNTNLFEFAKKVALELYEKTQNKSYLNDVISLHESTLYNRIRSRLNSRTSMKYADVPKKITEEEQKIKQAIKTSLTKSDNMDGFIKANLRWTTYVENLRKKYPKYYQLRFASITQSVKDIEQKIPKNTTIVRYFYAEKELFAVLLSKNSTQLFKLNSLDVVENINRLQDGNSLFKNNFKTMNDLYISLWKPFEKHITTSCVVIIPDRDLFNLNFEMLTPKVLSNYKEMAVKSLLSKYQISYNYSLFLIEKGSQTVGYKDNFVAFVPEFNDKMKSDYQISIKDSMRLDKTYLTLLSQPFTKQLAQQSARLFNGSSFLNEKSTEQLFKNNAKEHKIIHIGTHAESNNVSPELSRLVFAKSIDLTNTDDNYLYTHEIYNTNLSSNLAILTACETGKPTYQAGEGMISLAHAFSYAGSESILTSLWKIDEQSSKTIIESFYNYLKKGWAKDRALQQAKLDYIATAEGRMIHPQYWAGLVLIGDSAPIELSTSYTFLYWILAIIALLTALFIFQKKKLK